MSEIDEKMGEEREAVTLQITLQPDGSLQVSAPGDGEMYNEPLCLWLLEKAKDFVKGRNSSVARSRQPRVKPHPFIPPQFRQNGRVR